MVANLLDLTGKRILVTGASSGIGRETAILFSKLGASLTLMGRSQDKLEETLTCLVPGSHQTIVYDLTELDGLPKLLKSLGKEGGAFAGLFHAAGAEAVTPLPLINQKAISKTIDLNFSSALMLARGFSQKGVHVKESSSFVIMSSVAGQRGQAGMATYCASKGALDSLVRALAVELAPKHIRVNSIVAGAVKTDMHERLTSMMSEDAIQRYEEKHPLGFGSAEDIAQSGAFLVSSMSRWVTGTSMVVDGGFMCR